MKAVFRRLWPILFWLAVWQLGSLAVGRELFLPGPWRVLVRLWSLMGTARFWGSVGYTLLRIAGGFGLAVLTGGTLAMLAARLRPVRQLLSPLMLMVRSIPVASFIILALIWFTSRGLSVFISFLMVLPIIYTNTLMGLDSRDPRLREMAQVFRLPAGRRARYVELPQVLPAFRAGCRLGLGLAWKSGVAAEVIGMPTGSIGAQLQQAKVYLETADVFAWTVVIVLISLLFERSILFLLDRLAARLERL